MDLPLNPADRLEVNLRTLVRLRWVTIGIETVLVLAGEAAGWPVARGPMLGMLAFLALSNAPLQGVEARWVGRAEPLAGAVLLLDSLALTALLGLGGAASNPFTALYFLYVVAAALLTSPRWTAAVLITCALGYGGLFLLPADPHAMHLAGHLSGMWGAFVILGSFFALAIVRLRRELAAADDRARATRDLAARAERLASLATLATGAAHELSTPLGTIAVAAHEMQQGLDDLPPDLLSDARLIAEQVERCRHILDDLAADAGSTRGESFAPTAPAELVAQILGELPEARRARVQVEVRGDEPLLLPRRMLGRAVRGLVRNALDAAGEAPISLRVHREPTRLIVDVRDPGPGLSPEVLARAGEPFFTTKEAGRGMGLGLFFARSVARSLGGALSLSNLDPGACASVALPIPLEPRGL